MHLTATTERRGVRIERAAVPSPTLLVRWQYFGDGAVLLAAGTIAGVVTDLPVGVWASATGLLLVALMIALHGAGTYLAHPPRIEVAGVVKAVRVIAWTAPVLMTLALLLHPGWRTLAGVGVYVILALTGIPLSRTLLWRRWSAGQGRVAICGMNGDAVAVADRVAGEQGRVAGVLTHNEALEASSWPRLGSCEDLISLYRSRAFDEVVFSVPQSSLIAASLSLRAARDGIPFRFAAGEGNAGERTIEGVVAVGIRSPMGPVARATKRLVDIVLSLVALTFALPLFAVLAVAIPLDSPGSMIFRQRRVGKDGKFFTILKFRTMYMRETTDEHTPRSRGDDRITRIGRYLRATSLDEIPQFINVLRGEMSVVGPRPEMPFIAEHYTPLERARLVVRPGITGIWQISPHRRRPIHEHIYYDLYYVQRQSLLLDLVVVLQTVFFACSGI